METVKECNVSVHAPRTPGVTHTVVGEFDNVAEARAFCKKFNRNRKDMNYHDVEIRLGRNGKRIEFAGP